MKVPRFIQTSVVQRKNLLEIFDGNPLNTVLDCDGHSGPITIKFSNMPALMQVLISHVISDPDESNATWVFNKPKKIDLDP